MLVCGKDTQPEASVIEANKAIEVNVMYKDLPENIQQQILAYLQADEFVAAKALMDAYRAEQSHSAPEVAIA